jgi:hypothetical protein
MKKITYITGAIFSSMTLIGMLFKIQHWPGASILSVFGIAGIALVFIPIFTIYRYNKNNKK